MSGSSVYIFRHAYDLTAVLYAIAAMTGIVGALFGWLAYLQLCEARRLIRVEALHPGWKRRYDLSRLAFEFDLFRGFWFAMFSWCILSIVMAIEPRYWVAEIGDHTVLIGWIVLVSGFAMGFALFAGGRAQEHLGFHQFQELAASTRERRAAA